LLNDAEIDAVIVAGNANECHDALRQFVHAGKAVLFAPPLVQPAEFFYELALIEAESPGSFFPLLALRGHPLVLALRDLLSEGDLGKLRHVQLDRKIAAFARGPAPLFSQAEFGGALLCDADLLRFLCGAYDQVTASRSGDLQRGYSLATVTLGGNSVPQAVWTAAATAGEPDWRLSLSGEAGTAVLEGDPESARLRLTVQVNDKPATSEVVVDDAAPWLLDLFAASAGKGHTLWEELACDVELVDAVERSVRRRRTIDVFFETPSERGIFKTQMTAVGCSLLVMTLVAVVFYLGLAATIELPPLLKKLLVVLIFLPLGAFLALQLLLFVARPAARDNQH
jgi:predicted dehydrogenase